MYPDEPGRKRIGIGTHATPKWDAPHTACAWRLWAQVAAAVDVVAFLFPTQGVGNYCSTKHRLQPYVTSVDAIEVPTGLGFVTNLSDDVEVKVESVVHAEVCA